MWTLVWCRVFDADVADLFQETVDALRGSVTAVCPAGGGGGGSAPHRATVNCPRAGRVLRQCPWVLPLLRRVGYRGSRALRCVINVKYTTEDTCPRGRKVLTKMRAIICFLLLALGGTEANTVKLLVNNIGAIRNPQVCPSVCTLNPTSHAVRMGSAVQQTQRRVLGGRVLVSRRLLGQGR